MNEEKMLTSIRKKKRKTTTTTTKTKLQKKTNKQTNKAKQIKVTTIARASGIPKSSQPAYIQMTVAK
jgi:hypothetical protein